MMQQRFLGLALLFLAGVLLAACQQAGDSAYLPLVDYRVHTYDVRVSQGDNTQQQRQVVEITGPHEADGQTIYLRNIGGRYQQALTREADGVYLIGDIPAQTLRLFDEPALLMPAEPAVGDTWQGLDYSRLLEWRKHALEHADKSLHKPINMQFECVATDETVNTPAGRFHDVLRIEGTGEGRFELGAVRDLNRITIAVTHWYAPGVGLIKSERRESSDTGLLIAGEEKRVLQRYE
ncbi:hypothetical protein J2T55_002131 [Methylohalomonas lacus]|uniref:DUF3108 domain-containing protein n=1 Tax=Methylohalomonas lacus TaxID=398773 RepID=A0AAE3HMJ2_9GAMM|nr:hypothetical protein [Methylohalomonas lacus]MCS3904098.1 hypothetical protein [Methylohalomonas lacus]